MTNRYSDGQYARSNPTWHDEDAPWKAAQVARILRANRVTPETVCDIGCGSGGVLAALRPEIPSAQLVGYELSPQAVEIAHSAHPGIDVRHADASQVDETFDLVLMMDVFEHIEDYIGFLRVLAERGRHFVFHIPLDMTALMVLRGTPIMVTRQAVGHLHYFSKDTALATLADADYEIVDWNYASATIDGPKRTTRMKLLKWPRKVAFRLAPDLTVRSLGGYTLVVLARPALRLMNDSQEEAATGR